MEKKRAVIYCRVSTSSDSQVESLDKQVMEALEAVQQLGYELVDQFIDSGKTGTTKDTRKEYLRMISQIEDHAFDVIVTKSLDRMNRNILDFYLFLDLIIRNEVKLYFYLDRAYYKADDKIVIGIKAILAEEYSRELSKKLCNAHAKRQERGQVVMLSSLTYGYRKVMQPDGKRSVVIEEDEARMIQLIFDYCREGYGARAISNILFARGYRNRNGNQITEGTIRRIIRNPLVMGTMVMNKVRFDFNTKATVHTEPSQWIRKEDAVPAIITRAEWEEANRLMDSRVRHKPVEKGEKKLGINTGKFSFSGKITCSLCGKPYYRAGRNINAKRVYQWRCSTYMQFGRKHAEKFKTNAGSKKVDTGKGCDGISLDEELLIDILNDVSKQYFENSQDKQTLIHEVMSTLEKILKESSHDGKAEELQKKSQTIQKRQETLLEKYLDGKVEDEIYTQMDQKLRDERERVKNELEIIQSDFDNAQKAKDRMKKIENALLTGGFEQATAFSFLESVKKIVVYSSHLDIIVDSFLLLGMDGVGALQEGEEYTMHLALEQYLIKNVNAAMEQSKKMICNMILENPKISIAEIAEKLNIGKRTAFSRVRDLKAEGKIGVRGHGPGTVWYVIDESLSNNLLE